MRKAILFLAISSLKAAAVDPALAGFWSLDGPGVQVVYLIAADGHYQVWGSLSDSGTIQASNGKWTTASAVTRRQQIGTYSVSSTALSTVGPKGPAHWTRETAGSLAGGLIPKDVPKLAQNALDFLRRNIPDATLVMIEVKKPSPVAHPIELRFYSKATNHIYVAGEEPFTDLGPPNSEELPVAVDFVDLPQAVSTARSNGMKGVFGNAILMTVTPPQGAPVTIWQVSPAQWDGELARTVDARSGKALDTARVTPMIGTDAEIMTAVHKIQGVIQAGVAKAAPAGLEGTRLASCGERWNFKGGDPPVEFSALHLNFTAYGAYGPEDFYIPLRAPLTLKEQADLSLYFAFFSVSGPGIPRFEVLQPQPSDYMEMQFAEDRLKQMALSGCK